MAWFHRFGIANGSKWRRSVPWPSSAAAAASSRAERAKLDVLLGVPRPAAQILQQHLRVVLHAGVDLLLVPEPEAVVDGVVSPLRHRERLQVAEERTLAVVGGGGGVFPRGASELVVGVREVVIEKVANTWARAHEIRRPILA